MSIESRERGREIVGKFFEVKDVLENKEFALDVIEANINKGKIFAVNHFSLFDGPTVVGNLFRFEQMRQVEMGLPVTDYLYKYADFLNRKLKLELRLTSVVTPASVAKGKVEADRIGEGLRDHMRMSVEILRSNGAEVVFPQATRDKGGLGEPGSNNRAMEGLLRLNQRADPVVIPVGIYAEGISPRYLYWANPLPYQLKFGEPRTAEEIREAADRYMTKDGERHRPFEGADAIVYGMIRNLLPEDYR